MLSSELTILGEVDFLTALEGLLNREYDAIFGTHGGVLNLSKNGVLRYARRKKHDLNGIMFSASDYLAPWRIVTFVDSEYWFPNLDGEEPDEEE